MKLKDRITLTAGNVAVWTMDKIATIAIQCKLGTEQQQAEVHAAKENMKKENEKLNQMLRD